jgi:hypothetical protein
VIPSGDLVSSKDPSPIGTSLPEPSDSIEICNSPGEQSPFFRKSDLCHLGIGNQKRTSQPSLLFWNLSYPLFVEVKLRFLYLLFLGKQPLTLLLKVGKQ